jgi:ATP-dependent DNA helicase RecG
VIEVGIDIPNATIIVIEHAERFGISQLHQLRGRVSRSNRTAYCIFITPKKITEDAQKRLDALTKYNDGFKLSEIDLLIRGPGELMGTKQHGIEEFKFTDITNPEHKPIISSARKDAINLLQNDPRLKNYPKLKEAVENFNKQIEIIIG